MSGDLEDTFVNFMLAFDGVMLGRLLGCWSILSAGQRNRAFDSGTCRPKLLPMLFEVFGFLVRPVPRLMNSMVFGVEGVLGATDTAFRDIEGQVTSSLP